MASKPPLHPHYFTEGGIRYILELPDVYGNSGSTIGQAFGITRAQDTDSAPFEPAENDVGLSVSDGMKNGKLVRIRISYLDNTTRRTARVICPASRVDTGIRTVKAKTYKNGKVLGAGIPRRRKLG